MKDLKILGTRLLAGGVYKEVEIIGDCEVEGELNCSYANLVGNMQFDDKLIVNDNLSIIGNCVFNNYIESYMIDITGKLLCRGNIVCENFLCNGSINAFSISAKNVNICGSCRLNELNAEELLFENHIIEIDKIYARNINIKLAEEISFYNKSKIYVDYIECDKICVDAIKCNKLFANDVILGPNCEIEYIKYSNNIEVSPLAKVKEIVKL